MSKRNQFVRILFWSVFVLSFILFSCASKKPIWGDPQTGFILQYRIAPEQMMNYKMSIGAVTSMDIMGQTMETTSNVNLNYSMKGTGIDNQKNLLAQIGIEALDIVISGMQGKTTLRTSPLVGKSFGLTLSPTGNEIEFIGIESIPKINFGEMEGGERSVQPYFSDIFPDLSNNPIKVGDTWTGQKEYHEPMGSLDLTIKVESTNILEDFETIGDLECARIRTESKGTVSGAGSQEEMYMMFNGDLESTSIWYFAFKEGVFVRMEAEQNLDANIDIGDMGNIPMVTKDSIKIELIR
ncbi:hypothetical protein MUP95_00710 [bacterium]|nr:hypothetical protein [bacterium]